MLNEAAVIESTLINLQFARQQGDEIIVVDGGSTDASVAIARQYADKVIETSTEEGRGRGAQMDRGVQQASGNTLLFLHSDTHLSRAAFDQLERVAEEEDNCWGWFNIRLSGRSPMFRIIEKLINLRSRWSSIATGDQAIFVTQTLFAAVGGYRALPLMEDVDLSKRLKACHAPSPLSQTIETSSRRWEERGVIRTVLLMWALRLGFWMGVKPDRLQRLYR